MTRIYDYIFHILGTRPWPYGPLLVPSSLRGNHIINWKILFCSIQDIDMVITYSLMGMTCLCCVFLCIMVSYLCVVVRQIRLGLREFLQDERMNSTEPLVNPRKSSEYSLEPQVVYRKQERPQGDSERGKAKTLESPGYTPNIEHFRAHPFSPKPKRSSQKSSDTSKDKNSNPKRTEALDVERTIEKRGGLSSIRALAQNVHQSAVNSNPCQLVGYQQRNSVPQGCLTPNIEDVRMSRRPKMIVNIERVSEDSKSDSEDCFSGKTGAWEKVPESLFSKVDQWNNSAIERCGTMDISKIWQFRLDLRGFNPL